MEDLGIHQRHKISSESLKGPAGIVLPPHGGDAYWFLVCVLFVDCIGLSASLLQVHYNVTITMMIPMTNLFHHLMWLSSDEERDKRSDANGQEK